MLMWCHRCETVCPDDVFYFNSKKAITALLSHFQLRIPVEKVLPCGHPAVNEFPPPIILYSTLPLPHPNPIIQSSICPSPLCGRCWALLSVWYHFYLLNDACLFCGLSKRLFSLSFYANLQNAFHICFIFSGSCMMWAFLILTYMTTAVMGRNVLRLKRNVHQTGGPRCACRPFDLQ